MPATATARDSTAPRATLLFVHPPKTGGSTIGSLFQPRRRLYDVLARPEVAGGSILYHGGHRSSAELAAKCDVEQECCAWLMSFREPLARLRSAFATSVEDHQHFDCPRGSRLHRWLRRAALSLERFARFLAAERRACGLNVYLDLLAPPLGRRDTEAARLQRSLARVARLPLVALTEEFSRSLALLDAALDLRLGHFPAVYTYNPRDSRSAANLSARAARALSFDLRPDTLLYEAAVRRFAALWRRQFGGEPADGSRGAAGSGQLFQCAWGRARCWDKLSTSHQGWSEPAASRGQRRLGSEPAYRSSDAADAGRLEPGPSGWPLLRRQPTASGSGTGGGTVRTWPIGAVESSSLWRRGKRRDRRQRLLCAAPCSAGRRRGAGASAEAREARPRRDGAVERKGGAGAALCAGAFSDEAVAEAV